MIVMVAAACGGGATQPAVVVASSNASLAVGHQRLIVGLIDTETQAFVAAPDVSATASFTGPNGETIDDVSLDFMWAIPDVRGLYRANVDFPAPGAWSLVIAADGFEPTEPSLIMVNQTTTMPQVGDPAPVVATRTSEDATLAEISTDPDPEPSFYLLSLDDALTDDRPTVIVFATPAFCTSETCGPVLDQTKETAARHPDVDFIHVEIYENVDAASFDDLIPVEAVGTWALPSEPWVFVTDADGLVTARFEGVLDNAELEDALAELGA